VKRRALSAEQTTGMPVPQTTDAAIASALPAAGERLASNADIQGLAAAITGSPAAAGDLAATTMAARDDGAFQAFLAGLQQSTDALTGGVDALTAALDRIEAEPALSTVAANAPTVDLAPLIAALPAGGSKLASDADIAALADRIVRGIADLADAGSADAQAVVDALAAATAKLAPADALK
jgi:hypothetical protein